MKWARGYKNWAYKHWLSWHHTFKVWQDMIARCSNPKRQDYKYYWGKGVIVCENRKEFINFYNDLGSGREKWKTIERIDVNGDYPPSNCKRVSMKEQCNNRTSNNKIAYKWIILNLTQRAGKIWVKRSTLNARYIRWNPVNIMLREYDAVEERRVLD